MFAKLKFHLLTCLYVTKCLCYNGEKASLTPKVSNKYIFYGKYTSKCLQNLSVTAQFDKEIGNVKYQGFFNVLFWFYIPIVITIPM